MRYAGVGVFMSLAGMTGMLGFWQLKRRKWKIELIESRKKNLQMEPINLEEALSDPKDFRQVCLTGSLDYSKEMIVGPRSPPGHVDSRYAGTRGGYYLVTPMTLTDGTLVLVNRGWVKAQLMDIIQRESTDTVTFSGVLRKAEQKSSFLPKKAEKTGRNWLYVDPDEMLSNAMKENMKNVILLDVLSPKNPTGVWPARKAVSEYVNYHTTPEMHLVYAGTWFSLAGAIAGLTMIRFRPWAAAAVLVSRGGDDDDA